MIKLESFWPERIWNKDLHNCPADVQSILLSVYQSLNGSSPTEKPPFSDEEWEEFYSLGINLLQAVFRKSKNVTSAELIKEKFIDRLGITKTFIENKEINTLSAPYWAIFGAIDASKPSLNAKQLRIGPEISKTTISVDAIKTEFNFKLVVSESESPEMIAEVYQALFDLSDAIKLPKKWIGSSIVTLAIGTASSEDAQVIQYPNECKSIAQQWMLCLDMRIAAAIRAKMPTVDRYASTMYQESLAGDLNQKLIDSYRALHQLSVLLNAFANKPAQFTNDINKFEIDRGVKTGSMTAVQELVALSFNYYVSTRLDSDKRKNDYLCMPSGDFHKGIPTPNPSEGERIITLFDKLLNTMRPAENLTSDKTS